MPHLNCPPGTVSIYALSTRERFTCAKKLPLITMETFLHHFNRSLAKRARPVRTIDHKDEYFTGGSITSENMTSNPPHYATHYNP